MQTAQGSQQKIWWVFMILGLYALGLGLPSRADSATVTIVSDKNWRSTDAVADVGSCPASPGSIGPAWTQPGFDDRSWRQAYAPYPWVPEGPLPGSEYIWDWPFSGSPDGKNGPNQAFFRRSVVLDGVPTDATVEFIADDEAQFYINGILAVQDVDGGASRTGPINITSYLKTGENVFAVRAWDGGGCSVSDRVYEKFSVVITITTAPPAPAHTTQPGSLLIFPFLDIAAPVSTTLCITDTVEGPFNQVATWVRVTMVCKGKKGPNPFCDEVDVHVPITYQGTVCLDLANDPRYTPPCAEGQGFAVAFAETNNGIPQSHNTLIGHAQIAAPNVLAEANAIAVQSPATTGATLGAVSPTTGDYGLRFGPGGDYLSLPDTLQGTFRATVPGQYSTALIVLTLDIISGAQNPASRIAIDFWNANEVRYSAAHEFVCWDAVPLSTIDSRFNQAGLGTAFGSVRLTATSTCPFPGLCPPVTPLTPTLLGALVDMGPGPAIGVRNLFHSGARATVYYPE